MIDNIQTSSVVEVLANTFAIAVSRFDVMSQVYEEIDRGASADNCKHHESSYMSLHQHEMVEMTPADGNRVELDEQDAQNHDYGKLLAEMGRLIKRGFNLLVVLLVVLLLLLLVFGITSVTLMSQPASAEESKAATTSIASTETTTTSITSTETTTTSIASTEATTTSIASTEAPYTQRSFTYLASTDLESICFSAFYKPDGNILVGTDDGVKLISRRNLAVTSYNTSFKVVTSIVEHHNIAYLLHKEGNVNKVELCLPEMNNCQTLLEFNNTSDYASTMAVSSRYIVVKNPVGEKLIIYDFLNKQKKIKQPVRLNLPYFLLNGHMLARNSYTLTKYRLDDGELTELWTCGGLTNLGAMVADTDGFIYGLSYREKSVYVISPDGELLQTIHNDKLPSGFVGQASISEDEIAVPGWGENKLHIFKINN